MSPASSFIDPDEVDDEGRYNAREEKEVEEESNG